MGRLTRTIWDHIGDLLEIRQAGLFFYNASQLDAIKDALFKFQQKSDTKAAIIVSFAYVSGQVCSVVTVTVGLN